MSVVLRTMFYISESGYGVPRIRLLLYYDVGCAFDTCSLHVPGDVRLKRADFEVGENGRPKRTRTTIKNVLKIYSA